MRSTCCNVRKTFNRVAFLLAALLMSATLAVAATAALAPANEALADDGTRYIDVVYDDSGSMDNDQRSWCHAHYAIEVFAAMLGPNDVLRVYTMSSADLGRASADSPDLEIFGSDDISTRVAQAHEVFSPRSKATTFLPAQYAYSHLSANPDNERWLIVLTDGAFHVCDNLDLDNHPESGSLQDVSKLVEGHLTEWAAEGINVEYVAMGLEKEDEELLPTGSEGFSVNSIPGDAILEGVIAESNKVFSRAELSSDTEKKLLSDGTLDIEIPMSRIVVFAQGEDVEIGALTTSGKTVSPETAQVKYADMPHSDPDKVEDWKNKEGKPDTQLQGVVATFQDEEGFRTGSGQIDIKNARTVSVYYEPKVEMELSVTDSAGNTTQITEGADISLAKDDYTAVLHVRDPFTHELINSSLVHVDASASFVYDDGTQVFLGSDPVELVEGTGQFQTDTIVNKEVDVRWGVPASIVPKDIEVQVLSGPTGPIKVKELASAEPIVIKVTKQGEDLSPEQWDATEITVHSPEASHPEGLMGAFFYDKDIDYTVEKGEEVSTYVIHLAPYQGQPKLTLMGDVPLDISASYDTGAGIARGDGETNVNIKGIRLPKPALFITLAILALIAAFIIMELTKKRLPKLSPRIILDGGEEQRLQYSGAVQHRIWPPWSPETTDFTVRVSGDTQDNNELGERFELGRKTLYLVADKKVKGKRRMKFTDSTLSMLEKHTATDRYPDPAYGSGIKKAFGRSSSFSFTGNVWHRRRGWVDGTVYTIKFG